MRDHTVPIFIPQNAISLKYP